MSDDLSARRAAAVERLEGLHRERGAVVANGEKFDHGRIAAVERELAEIEDLESEETRRARAAAAEDAERCRRERIAGIEAASADYRQAVADGQQAAHDFADALGRGHAAFETLRKFGVPGTVHESVERRWSLLWAGVVKAVTKPRHASRIGQLSFHNTRYRPDTDWLEVEQEHVGRKVDATLWRETRPAPVAPAQFEGVSP